MDNMTESGEMEAQVYKRIRYSEKGFAVSVTKCRSLGCSKRAAVFLLVGTCMGIIFSAPKEISEYETIC